VVIDREPENILQAHPESEYTLSNNILFYIHVAGYIVRSLSGSDECINQLIGEPGAGVDHQIGSYLLCMCYDTKI